jgi:hypothetical protein
MSAESVSESESVSEKKFLFDRNPKKKFSDPQHCLLEKLRLKVVHYQLINKWSLKSVKSLG